MSTIVGILLNNQEELIHLCVETLNKIIYKKLNIFIQNGLKKFKQFSVPTDSENRIRLIINRDQFDRLIEQNTKLVFNTKWEIIGIGLDNGIVRKLSNSDIEFCEKHGFVVNEIKENLKEEEEKKEYLNLNDPLHNLDLYININYKDEYKNLHEFISDEVNDVLFEIKIDKTESDKCDLSHLLVIYWIDDAIIIGYKIESKKGKYTQLSKTDYKQPVIKYQEKFKQTRLLPYRENLYKTKLEPNCIGIIMKYVDIDISKREIDVFVF
jgi:hypothetical protein